VHNNLDAPPPTLHVPVWGTVSDLDFAGQQPLSLVRIGNSAGQIATSTDGGNTWTELSIGGSYSGGFVTYTANTTSIIWSPTSAAGSFMSYKGGAFMATTGLPAGAVIEADKVNDAYVYASYAGKVYVSSNSGMSYTYVNQLGSASASRSIATSTLAAAGEFWVSTDHGIWHLCAPSTWLNRTHANASQDELRQDRDRPVRRDQPGVVHRRRRARPRQQGSRAVRGRRRQRRVRPLPLGQRRRVVVHS
jgi:hypothetical protein